MTVQPTPESDGKILSAPRCRVAHAWLSSDVYELLEAAAAERGEHPDELAAALLVHMLLKVLPRRR